MLNNVEKAGDASLFFNRGRLEVRLERGVPRGAVAVRIKTSTEYVGDGLLSHRPRPALPWALAGLTAGFGMGPGVPPPLESPTHSVVDERYLF